MEQTRAKKLILIVDDDEDVRGTIADVLLRVGYRTAEAADGIEALELLRRIRPDVVLTDLIMPRMDGWALVAAMESGLLGAPIPICVVSAEDRKTPRAHGHIRKPFAISDLVAEVDRLARITKSTLLA